MSASRRYHEFAREHGVNKLVYGSSAACSCPRSCLVPARAPGSRARPLQGRPDRRLQSRSFLDPFVIGALLPWRRQIQFVAKVELFENRWQGWILSRLGAFPIRRGQSDETAMETAALAVRARRDRRDLSEGTRIRRGSLARPKRGVGRLALETGAPVLPVAVTGSEFVRRGWRIRPRKVRPEGRHPDDVPAHREAVSRVSPRPSPSGSGRTSSSSGSTSAACRRCGRRR